MENYASERYFYDVDFNELLNEAESEGINIDDEIKDLTNKVDKQLQKNLPLYNRFIHIPEEYINFYNELQVFQSYKYIFSKDENFSLALELIGKYPKLKNINRNRFLMG